MNLSKQKVELAMAERKLTKKELALRCNVSQQRISALLKSGTCEPKTAWKLASGLGVAVIDIIDT